MAYNTAYTLKIHDSSMNIAPILAKYLGRRGYEEMFYAIALDGTTSDSCTWYEHERDMAKLSFDYPYVVFELRGAGEEAGDLWCKYFHNGKIQRCTAKITYDEYDESKLVREVSE